MADTVTTPAADEVEFSDPSAQDFWNRLLVAKKLILEFAKGDRDAETKRFIYDLKLGLSGDILEDGDTGELMRFQPGQGRLLTMLIASQNAQMDAALRRDADGEAPR